MSTICRRFRCGTPTASAGITGFRCSPRLARESRIQPDHRRLDGLCGSISGPCLVVSGSTAPAMTQLASTQDRRFEQSQDRDRYGARVPDSQCSLVSRDCSLLGPFGLWLTRSGVGVGVPTTRTAAAPGVRGSGHRRPPACNSAPAGRAGFLVDHLDHPVSYCSGSVPGSPRGSRKPLSPPVSGSHKAWRTRRAAC